MLQPKSTPLHKYQVRNTCSGDPPASPATLRGGPIVNDDPVFLRRLGRIFSDGYGHQDEMDAEVTSANRRGVAVISRRIDEYLKAGEL